MMNLFKHLFTLISLDYWLMFLFLNVKTSLSKKVAKDLQAGQVVQEFVVLLIATEKLVKSF